MGSKIGLILSLPFIFIAFLFGIDFLSIQLTYTSLDSISTTVSFKIAKAGKITESIENYVKEEINASIEAVYQNHSYQKGSTYEYYLIKEYQPLIMNQEPLKLQIKRYAVIEMYN